MTTSDAMSVELRQVKRSSAARSQLGRAFTIGLGLHSSNHAAQ